MFNVRLWLIPRKPDIIVAFLLMDSSKSSRLKEVGGECSLYELLTFVRQSFRKVGVILQRLPQSLHSFAMTCTKKPQGTNLEACNNVGRFYLDAAKQVTEHGVCSSK